jgi:site-specific DNA-cytosine methylase/ParB-like chromosome segregation protein Spo0J
MLVYGCVCSGVGAATVAWEPLGWKPAWFSEVLPFPSAVLAHHYLNVPNLGDMTRLPANKEFIDSRIDLLVGGTPCQDFSQAGKRKGLEAQKGNLTLEFIKILGYKKPQWFVWENVPGVLSIEGGRVFGTILGKMADCGYGFAYRVLDSQHFGLLQSRPRVFVVGYLGDWRPPQKVLFDGPPCGDDAAGGHHEAGRIPALTLRNAGNGNARGVVVVEGTVQADGADGPFPRRAWQIRACTPGEEEQRQGLPKGYTRIAWDGKPAAECPDQPRYEAIGNTMAIPVVRRIGERIETWINAERRGGAVKPQSTPHLYTNSDEHWSTGFDGWMPSVNDLKPHPMNEKVYGPPKPDKKLIESIEKVGILQPIVIDRNKQILAGHRRWEACTTIAERQPNKDFRIPATIFCGSDFQAEQLIIESNRQRVKTPEQKAREFKELRRIEAALAKERMLAGRKIDPGKNFPKGRAEDNAAAAVGMSRPTAKKLEAIVRKADSGDSEARAALDAVNENKMSVDAAYRKVAASEAKRDPATIKRDERTARDFNWQCKAHALDAEVFRSEHEGRFRLAISNLAKIQVSRLLECLESYGGPRWNPSRPDSAPRPGTFFRQAAGLPGQRR